MASVPRLSLIAAVAENGTIGQHGGLPWHLSSDLRRFKKLTTGHAIIMGRRTFASIGRALPHRQNLVVTRRHKLESATGVELVTSLDAALDCVTGEEAFVIGGAELYREALPRAQRIFLTRVLARVDGDTFFPLDLFHEHEWSLVSDEPHEAAERDSLPFRFQVYHRIGC